MTDPSRLCAIAVMAKAPRPGHVKTRLQALLTAEEAAKLGGAFLRDVTENLAAAAQMAPIAPFVAYAPAGQEGRFDGLVAAGTQLVLADGEDGDAPGVTGFGRVLLHAARALFARGYGAVCVLNADSPTLPTALLAQAAQRLLAAGPRGVFGPAEDGGYWLLGLQSPEPAVFADIAWSTNQAGPQTELRAAAIGLRLDVLPHWYDVDDPAALRRLVQDLGEGGSGPLRPFAAPATAGCVARLGIAARLAAD